MIFQINYIVQLFRVDCFARADIILTMKILEKFSVPILAATTLISSGCVGAHPGDLVPGCSSLSGEDLHAFVQNIHQPNPTSPNNPDQTSLEH